MGDCDIMTSSPVKRLVTAALLFAVSIILSFLENMIPSPFEFLPGIKMGLSNIPVMYAIIFVKNSDAFAISALKSFFIFLTRGMSAFFLSLSGGVFSLIIMIILTKIFKEKISFLVLSVSGAISHNVMQLIVFSIVYTNMFTLYYTPLLVLSGVLAGCATAVLLKLFLPALKLTNT